MQPGKYHKSKYEQISFYIFPPFSSLVEVKGNPFRGTREYISLLISKYRFHSPYI